MVSVTEQSQSPSASTNNGNQEQSTDSNILSAFWIIGEFLVTLLIMLYGVLEATYRLFIPVSEKPVNEEIILITGTGHGMGKELALQYADLGATLVCVDINQETNDQTVKEVNEKKTAKAYGYICDVSNYEEVKKLVEKVKEEVGTVTVLVNNAGIMPCQRLLSFTPELIQKIYGINVFAHYWLILCLLPGMIEKKRGHIISTSSMAGLFGMANLVPYCGSKFAVRGMMAALNEEVLNNLKGSNIKCTTIYPHMVNTGLCQKPVIRFPFLFGLVDTKEAVRNIISAHRRELIEVSIPSSFLMINLILKLFPYRSFYAFQSFAGLGLDEHER